LAQGPCLMRVVSNLRRGVRLTRGFAAAAPAVGAAPTYKTYPFKKEDLAAVMAEVPDFNYYEIGENCEENPYKDVMMSQDVRDPRFKPAARARTPTQFSKLENGLRIASVDRAGPTSSVKLFVNAGSRHEEAGEAGVTHMLELAAFRSTAHLSYLRTVKSLETLGATVTATAEREHIVYSIDCLREYVPIVVPLVIGNVLFPRFLPWEVTACHELVGKAKSNDLTNPDAYVTELLIQTAFHNNTLGKPLHASAKNVGHFNPDTLRNYMLKHFAPERMALVGANVDHEELAKWTMRAFVDYNAIPLAKRTEAASQYTGGVKTVDANLPCVHVALGFKTGGWKAADLMAVNVLAQALGGGAGVGGPGAGAGSRLTAAMAKDKTVESAQCFHKIFSDAGLLGFYMSAAPEHAQKLVQIAADEAKKAASIPEAEVAMAKASLKTQLLMNFEDRAMSADDLGRQLMLGDTVADSSSVIAALDKVTAADVSKVAKAVFSSPLTYVAFGDCSAAPHTSAVEKLFK